MELHALEGTKSEVGQRRVPGTARRVKSSSTRATHTVVVKGRAPLEPPAHFDEDCAAGWREVWEACAAILDEADAPMVEMAAIALGRFRQARRYVAEQGLMVEGRFGQLVENPMLKVERDYAAMLHRASVELGIGPSARARFAGMGEQGKSASEALSGVADIGVAAA